MEITGFELYWILILDNLVGAAWFMVAVSIFMAFIFLIFAHDITLRKHSSADEDKEAAYNFRMKTLKITPIIISIFLLIATFLPTTKQMAAIVVLPSVINNEKVQQVPEQLLDVLGLSLKAIKKDLVEELKK